jgi:hypothetical protein
MPNVSEQWLLALQLAALELHFFVAALELALIQAATVFGAAFLDHLDLDPAVWTHVHLA